MEASPNPCKNCGQTTTAAYCEKCGQRSSVHKVTFRETIQDLADNLFSISAPLPRTVNTLILKPGLLFREYLEGKRKKYYKPISFFILATILFLFFRWLVDFDPFIEANTQADPQVPGSEKFFAAGKYMFQNINNLLFILVLTMALFLKLFFYRNYSLAEYVAVAFYLTGFYSLLAIINPLIYKFISPRIQFVAMLIMGIYFVYAMISFFEKRPVLTGLKSVFVYILAYVFYVILAFLFSFVIVVIRGV